MCRLLRISKGSCSYAAMTSANTQGSVWESVSKVIAEEHALGGGGGGGGGANMQRVAWRRVRASSGFRQA